MKNYIGVKIVKAEPMEKDGRADGKGWQSRIQSKV